MNKETFNAILSDLKTDEWIKDSYTIHNKTKNYEIWISNGWPCWELYLPYRVSFTLFQCFRLSKAINQAQERSFMEHRRKDEDL